MMKEKQIDISGSATLRKNQPKKTTRARQSKEKINGKKRKRIRKRERKKIKRKK